MYYLKRKKWVEKSMSIFETSQQDLTSWGVHIDEIPPEGLTVDFENFSEEIEGARIIESFYGKIKLKKLGYEVEVKGEIRGKVELICDKCLEPFEFAIEEEFQVTLLPKNALNIEGERELDSQELEVSFYENSFISFYNIISEEIRLALPFRKLCSSDCKGLCPVCGKNLNKESCSCKVIKKTSPFAVLKDLFKQGESKFTKEG